LLAFRKARADFNNPQARDTTATPEQIKAFRQVLSQTPHKASSPGLLAVDIHPADNDLIVTGGVDRTAVVLNRKTGKKEATLAGHGKAVTQCLFHPKQDVILTGSADHTVKIWTRDQNDYRTARSNTHHSGEIVGLSLHATYDYFAIASADQSYSFNNLETGQSLIQGFEPNGSPLTCGRLHPDGLIFAAGTNDNGIRIWDLKTNKNVATFQNHKGAITALAFSENGFYLATAAKDNQIKLWDLRGPKVIHSSRLDNEVASLEYDTSGKYLAATTGSEIRIFTGKVLEHVKTLDEHTNTVTAAKFGTDAKLLASVSMDRNLKLWGDN